MLNFKCRSRRCWTRNKPWPAKPALDPRRKAILDYAAKLTRDPAAVGPADAAPLRAQGLTDLDILDLTHAVAMFAWANRLMQTLGEPAAPAQQGNPL